MGSSRRQVGRQRLMFSRNCIRALISIRVLRKTRSRCQRSVIKRLTVYCGRALLHSREELLTPCPMLFFCSLEETDQILEVVLYVKLDLSQWHRRVINQPFQAV